VLARSLDAAALVVVARLSRARSNAWSAPLIFLLPTNCRCCCSSPRGVGQRLVSRYPKAGVIVSSDQHDVYYFFLENYV